MKLNAFTFVCDENIHPAVVEYLLSLDLSLKHVSDLNLISSSDEKILTEAHKSNSVVITHDSDFGKIVFTKKIPFTGILYLRPGHIVPALTIDTLKTLFENNFELHSPFMLIAERNKLKSIKVRIRNLG